MYSKSSLNVIVGSWKCSETTLKKKTPFYHRLMDITRVQFLGQIINIILK